MSLMITLFGGMLLAAALYAAGRLARLSNYWSAVAAAAVPSLLYMVYIVGRPAGLDTVTLHLIAYPTVAVMFGMLYSDKARRQNMVHWVPKALIGFFVVLSVMMAGFVYVAGQGLPPALAQALLPHAKGKEIHTGFAGVVEHERDAAKGIGQHQAMEEKLARLGWQVVVAGLNDVRAGQPTPVTVHLTDSGGRHVPAVEVSLELGRPGQTLGSPLRLSDAGEAYRAVLAPLEGGTWAASLRLGRGKDTVILEHTLEVR